MSVTSSAALSVLHSAFTPQAWEVLRLKTPTLPPATHTSCVIVGARSLSLIDPASPYTEAQEALETHLEARLQAGATLSRVLLTHHHPDHIGGVARLVERYGVEVWAHEETASRVPFKVTRLLNDGDVIEVDGLTEQGTVPTLIALHTPGHAPGHLCFVNPLTGEAAVGDMVAGEGTILIDPEEGDMQRYLAELARLERLGLSALWPSHGGCLTPDVLGRYQRHRLAREARVLAALSEGEWRGLAEVVALAYDDAPEVARRGREGGIAGRSAWAHLIKLEREGRVSRSSLERAWRLPARLHSAPHSAPRPLKSAGLAHAAERLYGVLSASRERCPWMSAQTHETLKRYLIEETSELLEVLEHPASRERAEAHRDELGDVLLQVTLQALIAEESRDEGGEVSEGFELREVFDTLSDKLVRRHPHVFAGARANTPDEVRTLWQAVKAQERALSGDSAHPQSTSKSELWRPPHEQSPPLSRAVALSDAAAVFGFDWPSAHGALDKVREERLEVLDAMERDLGAEAIEAELGDLLYAAVNACRQLKVDPAKALQGTCGRFQARVEGMLSLAQARGLTPSELSLSELEVLWVEVKRSLKP